jgi:hypothetical protein
MWNLIFLFFLLLLLIYTCLSSIIWMIGMSPPIWDRRSVFLREVQAVRQLDKSLWRKIEPGNFPKAEKWARECARIDMLVVSYVRRNPTNWFVRNCDSANLNKLTGNFGFIENESPSFQVWISFIISCSDWVIYLLGLLHADTTRDYVQKRKPTSFIASRLHRPHCIFFFPNHVMYYFMLRKKN